MMFSKLLQSMVAASLVLTVLIFSSAAQAHRTADGLDGPAPMAAELRVDLPAV
jgi:hypothetical protein